MIIICSRRNQVPGLEISMIFSGLMHIFLWVSYRFLFIFNYSPEYVVWYFNLQILWNLMRIALPVSRNLCFSSISGYQLNLYLRMRESMLGSHQEVGTPMIPSAGSSLKKSSWKVQKLFHSGYALLDMRYNHLVHVLISIGEGTTSLWIWGLTNFPHFVVIACSMLWLITFGIEERWRVLTLIL